MSETEKQNKTETDIEDLPENEASKDGDTEKAEPDAKEEDSVGELLKKIEQLQKEAQSNKDDALRHRAELENFRKRMQRDKDSLRKLAASCVIEDMIPVLDNLKLGLKSAEQHPEAKVVVDGFQMVASQLYSALATHGLKELNPKGERFVYLRDPYRSA